MRKRLFAMILAAAVAAGSLAGCGTSNTGTSEATAGSSSEAVSESTGTEAGKKLKVAWITDGSITDGAMNEEAYNTMHILAEEYDLDVSYQEGVETTVVADVIRDYARAGYDIVFDAEQYHCEIMADIAPEFPDVTFACFNGYVSADNMLTISGDMWQHIYLTGIALGTLSQSGKIGLITYATDSDSALTMKAAITAGAESVNPNAKIIHVATNSFFDVSVAKELATSLLNEGCECIFCMSGDCNETVIDMCVENGVYTVSAMVDRNDKYDSYMIGSALLSSGFSERWIIEQYLSGNRGSSEVAVMGLTEGLEEFRLNPNTENQIDPAVAKNLEQGREDIAAGKVEISFP